MVSKRRARIAPTTEGVTPLGATRGGVKDATERVKAQAIVIFHKSVAKGVIFQDDNAAPHTRSWSKLGLDAAAKQAGIRRGDQPARSPDLNVLDLMVWRVLEAGVHRRRPGTLTELWDAIKASWEEDLTEDKIEMAYRLLTPVMTLINDHNGGSNFKLPHTGLRKQMREDGWDY